MKTHLLLALLATTAAIRAGDKPAAYDKSVHHLFNPTPAAQMRDLSTDRPDVTESPYSVDAGHVQLEMDLAAYTRDRHTPDRDGVRTDAWSFATVNAKIGLTNRIDLQIVAPVFNRVRLSGAGSRDVSEGFGDLTFRLKYNLWGNDGGSTAMALMPFVKVPTASDGLGNDAVEGGLIIPFGAELGGGWGFGAMLEVDVLRDGDDRGHHAEFVTSVTFSHDIFTPRLSGYLEFVSVLSTERDADWVAQFDCGVAFAVTENVQLDAGVNFGLTRATDDVNPFVGLTIRF